MERWSLNDCYLIDLILEGKKKATSGIYDSKEKSFVGEENIITCDGIDICKIRIINVKNFKFKDAKQEDVIKEGEGNLDEWRRIHLDFFSVYYPDFNEDDIVEFIEFEVIEIFK